MEASIFKPSHILIHMTYNYSTVYGMTLIDFRETWNFSQTLIKKYSYMHTQTRP